MAGPQVIDLRTQTPAGWQLLGFSEVQSDGVNPFRVPALTTQVRFSAAQDTYLRFQLQLYAPQEVTATVQLDGRSLGEFHFAGGRYVTVYPSAFVTAGAHTLTFHQHCASACTILQYHAEAQLYPPEVAPLSTQRVGYQAWRWDLNTPRPTLTVRGLSEPQYDGSNFFRLLPGLTPATLEMPAGQRPTNLRVLLHADNGAARLVWTAQGQPLAARNDDDQAFASPGHEVVQNVPLVFPRAVTQLEVHAECEGGGSGCLPLKLYHVELTTVIQPAGFSALSAPKQGLSLGLLALLCSLATWLLRPWRARG